MAFLFLIGRLMVGGFFLLSAYNHLANLHRMTMYAAARGVPSARVAVIVATVLLAVAGASLLLGLVPRLGILAAVAFLVPVSVVMHPFWTETAAVTRTVDMVNFLKNMALLGASLMFLAIPEPWPLSVESALRRRARRQPLSLA